MATDEDDMDHHRVVLKGPKFAELNENHTDVLIIGAGIAGIAAGEYLTKNGFTDFKILESTDRIGGRIWTQYLDDNGMKAEMGANWIHGIERNPIYQIADENGLLQLRYKDKGLRHRNIFLTENGDEVSGRIVKEVDFTYGLLIQQCEEFYQMGMPTPYDVDSVGEYMKTEISEKMEGYSDNERKLRQMIFDQHMRQESVVSGCNDLEDVSLSEFGCYEELPGIHYTIPPGFQCVLDILVDKLPNESILLNHAVKCIQYDGPFEDGYRVLVECENGQKYYANHVIITVSLGVLKAECDRLFEPHLPQDKVDAIEHLGFGTVDKLILYFDKPIVASDVFRIELLWDDEKYKEEERTKDMAKSWYRKIYSFEVMQNDNLMLGWLCGKEALYMESLSDEQIAIDCQNVLKKFLKKDDIPKPNKIVRTRWGKMSNCLGSYCYIKVGATISDVETLMEPINDSRTDKPTLMFAGEATHPSFYSTTHGALLTGHREAQRILDSYDDKSKSHREGQRIRDGCKSKAK